MLTPHKLRLGFSPRLCKYYHIVNRHGVFTRLVHLGDPTRVRHQGLNQE